MLRRCEARTVAGGEELADARSDGDSARTQGLSAVIMRIRRFLRFVLAVVIHYSGLLSIRGFIRRRIFRQEEFCILCLHRVLSFQDQTQSHSLPGMVLREETFVELLDYLKRWFLTVPLEVLLKNRKELGDRSKPRCVVTFDDGWIDNFTTAYPWLKKFGVPAVIFVVPDFVESGKPFWVEQLVHAWREPHQRERIQSRLRELAVDGPGPRANLEDVVEWLKHMVAQRRQRILGGLLSSQESERDPEVDRPVTWDQLREMCQKGIEVGSHTVSHPLLTYEDDATVERELRECKQVIEERLATNVRAFAYPNGDWDPRVRKMVQQAGYECAFTTCRGWHRHGEDPFTIRRIMLHEGKVTGPRGRFSPAMLSLSLTGWR